MALRQSVLILSPAFLGIRDDVGAGHVFGRPYPRLSADMMVSQLFGHTDHF